MVASFVHLSPAAYPLAAPAADGQLKISALDRNLAQTADMSRPYRSRPTSTRTRTSESHQESHDASSSCDSARSVAHSLEAVPVSDAPPTSAGEMNPGAALDLSLAHMLTISVHRWLISVHPQHQARWTHLLPLSRMSAQLLISSMPT